MNPNFTSAKPEGVNSTLLSDLHYSIRDPAKIRINFSTWKYHQISAVLVHEKT